MKKTVAILLTLVLIAAGSILFVHNWIGSLGDDVTVKETILAGDKKAAEGVVVTTNSHYEETPLFWETTCIIGNENKVETQLDVDRERKDEWVFEETLRLNLGYNEQMNWYGVGGEGNPESEGYPMKVFEDVIADVKPGGKHQDTVKLSEYIPYRNISMNISLYGESGYVKTILDGRDDGGYFKFPMTEYSDTTVRVEMSSSGQISSLTVDPQHMHHLDEKSILTEDLNHVFTAVGDMILVERNAGGMQLDVRSVPLEEGTCGVHRFDVSFREAKQGPAFGEIDISNGQLIYPLKQGTSIVKLWFSEDGSQLLLLTLEDEDMWLTVLDSKTYEEVQRLHLLDYESKTCDGVGIKEGEGYLAVFFEYGHMVLLTRDEKGYHLAAADRLNRGAHSQSFGDDGSDIFAVDYDEGRFAIVSRQPVYTGSYFLWIYEDGTCKFAGEYQSSLAKAGSESNFNDEDGSIPIMRYTYDNSISVKLADKTR